MYGYLIKFCNYKICLYINKPYDGVSVEKHKWFNTPYSNGIKDIPTNAPEAKGKQVLLSHYHGVNLMHGILSGNSVTGCFHTANLTPIMWFSKK